MKKVVIGMLALLVSFLFVSSVMAADAKCPAETMVKAAVKLIADKGLDAAKVEINKKDGTFAGATHVSLFDFKGVILAHPMKPETIGKSRIDEKKYGEAVKMAKDKGAGWVEDGKTYVERIPEAEMAAAASCK